MEDDENGVQSEECELSGRLRKHMGAFFLCYRKLARNIFEPLLGNISNFVRNYATQDELVM